MIVAQLRVWKNSQEASMTKNIKTPILQRPVAELKEYDSLLSSIKKRLHQAQVKAALSVNKELILTYWEIGKKLSEKINKAKWGENVIERLASDLKKEFPQIKGLSPRNLWGMKRFFEAYKNTPKLQQLVAEIPWGHHFKILEMLSTSSEREWYIRATIENGWSRTVLIHQIESQAHKRHGKAITNFKKRLPKTQSELAEETLKDPYCFDFLSLGQNAKERDLEKALVEQIRKFLTELGVGFAFVGSQYHLEVGRFI